MSAFLASGNLLGSSIEPEVSIRNTRLAVGRFSLCKSKPLMPICSSFVLLFQGVGSTYDGGTGYDTLRISDTLSGTIDLRSTAVPDGQIENIDQLSLDGGITSGFIVSNAGNPDLTAEISQETELGLDLGFLNNRVAVELTRYDKTTHDALIAQPGVEPATV